MLFQQSQKHCRYTFSNSEGHHDQLVKGPRKLKEDFSDEFPYLFLEKKVNKNKFERACDTKPEIAVAPTKRTVTMDKKKIIHRKTVSKPLESTFQNPLSRRGENPRWSDGRFTPIMLNKSEPTTDSEQPIRDHSNSRREHAGDNTTNPH